MKKKQIMFEIERLDPLGQGVSKIDDKICFIPKTLPGERGTADITAKKKGVHFAQLSELSVKSKSRIQSQCPHYEVCSGCNYLHTSYELELQNKLSSFERQLSYSPFKGIAIKCHAAPSRFGYRNRIQLHYDKSRELLGFFKGKSQIIHEVNECLLPTDSLKKEVRRLYLDNTWLDMVPPHAPERGHVELYEKENGTSIAWNQHYSSGGFSQVNNVMNDLAISLWQNFYESCAKPKNILDVFGGSGNLTRSFTDSEVTILDSVCDEGQLLKHQRFTPVDLYKEPEIPSIKTDLLILDPPRSGFKDTIEWINEIGPKYIGYQSCFSDTMIRDLKSLDKDFETIEIHLLDFFPGTHHFESIIFLKNTGVN